LFTIPEPSGSEKTEAESTKGSESRKVSVDEQLPIISEISTPVPYKSLSIEDLQEVIESFIDGFKWIQGTLSYEPVFQRHLDFLESHGYISNLPESVDNLKILNSSFTVSPQDNSMEPVSILVRSVFDLVNKFSQCLASVLRNPVITFIDFRVGDIALFMPVNVDDRKIWIAFNSNCPYRFLSEASLSTFQETSREKHQRKYILGRIILIDVFKASEETKAYPVPVGNEFYVCTCDPLMTKKNAANRVVENAKDDTSSVKATTGSGTLG